VGTDGAEDVVEEREVDVDVKDEVVEENQEAGRESVEVTLEESQEVALDIAERELESKEDVSVWVEKVFEGDDVQEYDVGGGEVSGACV